MSWRTLVVVGALVLVGGAIVGQPPRGPRPGRAGGPGRAFGGRIQYGEITDLNPQRGYIQLRSAADGSDQVVVVEEATRILRDEVIEAADLAVGETVSVTGVPLEVEARAIHVTPREQPAEEAPAGEPGTEGGLEEPTEEADAGEEERSEGAPPPGDRLSRAGATLTGVVVGVEPLRVEVWPGLVVRVNVGEDAQVSRAGPADFSALTIGTQIAALGERDRFGLLQAEVVRVGGPLMEMVGDLMRQLGGSGRGPRPGGRPEGAPGMGLPGTMPPSGLPRPTRPPAPGGADQE